MAFWTFLSIIGGQLSFFGRLLVPQGYPEIFKSTGTENQGVISAFLALLGSGEPKNA